MAFCDLLRMTVLLAAGAATVLAAVTAIVVGTTGDTLTLFVALAWWIIALIGGLILGLAESLAVWKLSTGWSEAVAFVILFCFILARPSGLFGMRARV